MEALKISWRFRCIQFQYKKIQWCQNFCCIRILMIRTFFSFFFFFLLLKRLMKFRLIHDVEKHFGNTDVKTTSQTVQTNGQSMRSGIWSNIKQQIKYQWYCSLYYNSSTFKNCCDRISKQLQLGTLYCILKLLFYSRTHLILERLRGSSTNLKLNDMLDKGKQH